MSLQRSILIVLDASAGALPLQAVDFVQGIAPVLKTHRAILDRPGIPVTSIFR